MLRGVSNTLTRAVVRQSLGPYCFSMWVQSGKPGGGNATMTELWTAALAA